MVRAMWSSSCLKFLGHSSTLPSTRPHPVAQGRLGKWGALAALSHNTHQLDLPEGSTFPKLKAHHSCPPFLPALSVVRFSLRSGQSRESPLTLDSEQLLTPATQGSRCPSSAASKQITAVWCMQEAQ